jgi:hypothetical protein
MSVTAVRLKARLNQSDFWRRVGVSQSAGSRYEMGLMPIPKPVRMLLELAYGPNAVANLSRLRGHRVKPLPRVRS